MRTLRSAIVALLVVGLVVAGYAGYRLFTEEPAHEPPTSRVTGTADDGWQEVTYRGVTVELPPDWTRLDASMCAGFTEHWGPPGLQPCADDVGLWFLASATFDPATGPGVHTVPQSAHLPSGGWGGYVSRGAVVVSVAADDQGVVRRVLHSASQVV